MELLQSWREPLGGKARRGTDHDPTLAGWGLHDPPGFSDLIKGFPNHRQGRLGGICQKDAATCALKQWCTGIILKLTNMLGNRARRHIQFISRLGEGQASGGRFESTKGIQGRKAVMSLGLFLSLRDFVCSFPKQ